MDERMDDIRAVMDAVGSERAASWASPRAGPWPSSSQRHTRSDARSIL